MARDILERLLAGDVTIGAVNFAHLQSHRVAYGCVLPSLHKELNVRKVIAAVLVTFFSSHIYAAGNVSGKVVQVRVDQTGNGMVFFEQPVSGSPPSCVIGAYNNALAFNTNTAGGRAILA